MERENGTYKISYDRRENVTAGFTERKGVASADVIGEDKLTVKDPHALRKENKDALKYALYQLLVKLTGRTLPWGNLTGIRPAKLAMGMIESGMKRHRGCPGNAGEIFSQSGKNCPCCYNCKQREGDFKGY